MSAYTPPRFSSQTLATTSQSSLACSTLSFPFRPPNLSPHHCGLFNLSLLIKQTKPYKQEREREQAAFVSCLVFSHQQRFLGARAALGQAKEKRATPLLCLPCSLSLVPFPSLSCRVVGMEGECASSCPQLLDLIPNEKVKDTGGGGQGYGGGRSVAAAAAAAAAAEEMKLELRLAPPGGEDEHHHYHQQQQHSVLSLGYPCVGDKRVFLQQQQQQQPTGYLQGVAGMRKELVSQRTSGKAAVAEEQQSLERKAHAAPRDAAGASSVSHRRSSAAPVVGWPPIRSFRKNLATSSSKPLPESENKGSKESGVKPENCRKGLFVKINMDGIPIGRKVDLKAYASYEKLSSAVEELFQGLLAAQKDPSATEIQNVEDKQAFKGLLDGSGEYTLVYEDNEGDRMLVGDDPWDMFVSTAKRLRVLKTSELSALYLGAVSRKRAATDC